MNMDRIQKGIKKGFNKLIGSKSMEDFTKPEVMQYLLDIIDHEVSQNNLKVLFQDEEEIIFFKLKSAIFDFIHNNVLEPTVVRSSPILMGKLIGKLVSDLKKGGITSFNKDQAELILMGVFTEEEVGHNPEIQSAIKLNITNNMFNIPDNFPSLRKKWAKTGVFTEEAINVLPEVKNVALQKIAEKIIEGADAFKATKEKWIKRGVILTQDDFEGSSHIEKALKNRFTLISKHGREFLQNEVGQWEAVGFYGRYSDFLY